MQSYEKFKSQILERCRAAFPQADVHISPVRKNNGAVLDGLIVMSPGSNISPTIYLEQIYEIYRCTGDFESIWRDLYAVYQECRGTKTIDLAFLEDPAEVLPYLFCRLISAERNAQLLTEVPHRMFVDLAVVYYIGVAANGSARASILITNDRMADWGLTEEELYETAVRNNRTKFPAEVISLSRFLESEDPGFCQEEAPLPLYILTNKLKYFGASALLDEDVLARFAQEEGDFYILPSSLHEVLLISKRAAPAPDTLNEIIRDVNRSHLDPQDILSDHLYTYSLESQSVE